MEFRERKRFLAKLRFRALVRTVIRNLYWLQEMPLEATKPQRAIIFVTAKKSTTLTLEQKTILNKPVEYRTREECRNLYKAIGDLKCFRNYPEHILLDVVSHCYFRYWPPGTMLIRQNHVSQAMYILISGEVNLLTSSNLSSSIGETNIVGSLLPGNSIGELSLINGTPNRLSVVTIAHCEFLMLSKEDFDRLLKDTVKKEWNYVAGQLRRFAYFRDYDAGTITEACMIAKRLKFAKNETILGDGLGLKNYVHLVISGKCQVVEQLYVEKVRVGRCTYYKLFEDFPAEGPAELPQALAASKSESSHASGKDVKSMKSNKSNVSKVTGTSLTMLATPNKMLENYDDEFEDAEEEEVVDSYMVPWNVETYFMQVCIFSELAVFPFGDIMRNRRAVAMTDFVEIIALPRYWINIKSRGNQWSSVQQYLENKIPSTKQVFELFVNGRKWRKYTRGLVAPLVTKVCCNVPHNIPYSVRIREDFEFDEETRRISRDGPYKNSVL